MPQINILIVEDDLTTQEMARMVLENAGYGVSVSRTAEEAEQNIRSLWPDIVLMDRELPGMDGLELTRRLKANEETRSIAVIAFSSRHSMDEMEGAIAAGSDGFVNKPFTVRGLLQTVAWHVAARQSTGGGNGGLRNSVSGYVAADQSSHIMETASNIFGGVMKLSRSAILSGLLLAVSAMSARAQTATQTVTFQVDAINQVAVTGTPSLHITAAVAGGAPTTVTSSGNTWAVTT
ncbi:MAG TPA: response regulator, partial [Gemmatimonadaceae bacterium]